MKNKVFMAVFLCLILCLAGAVQNGKMNMRKHRKIRTQQNGLRRTQRFQR